MPEITTPPFPNERVRKFDFSGDSTNKYTVEGRHQLIPRCGVCHKGSIVILDGAQYWNYFQRGMNLQDAFPTLTSGEREIMKTGIHPDCWDALFAEEADDAAE